MTTHRKKKVLWIAPVLNFYKAKNLSLLNEDKEIEIVVLSGREMTSQGHLQDSNYNYNFENIVTDVVGKKFHISFSVYETIIKLLLNNKFDIVLMPVEKKHILLILFLFCLKFFFSYNLFSYNHTLVNSRNRTNPRLEILITKYLFHIYDKIIFYTEQGHTWALEHKLLSDNKAFFANNTLDTAAIWKNHAFDVNVVPTKTILFIGRLIPNKRVDLLFQYYQELKKSLPDLRLTVIGDGPEALFVQHAADKDRNITWLGAVVDEKFIAEEMRKAHVVFVPGASGLSIVHAFCYGKPYITLGNNKLHGPELSYLKDGSNGLLLVGDIHTNCRRMVNLLDDQNWYENSCRNAFKKSKELSIDKWCQQIRAALSA